MLKKIAFNSLIYAIGPQIPKLVGLILLPFMSQYLTKTDFGVWGTITAYTLIFSSARDLGMIVPMVNSFFKNSNHWKWLWRQIMAYLFYFGILLTIIQAILIYFIFPVNNDYNRFSIILMYSVQCLFLDVPIIFGTRLFQFKEQPIKISIISIISGIISVTLQFYFIYIIKIGYMGWFYGTFFGIFFMAISYFIILFKNGLIPIFKIKIINLKNTLRIALPLIPHNYSSYMLNTSDRVIMSIYKTPISQIGIYNIAYMWGNYMEIIGNAIGMAVGPTYNKLFLNNSKHKLFALTNLLFGIFLSIHFLVSLWLKEIFILLLKNDTLQSAYYVGIIIIMSYTYRPLYWLVVNKLQFDEETTSLWKISFASGLLNILLNIILIPKFGFISAAFSTFIAMIFQGFIGYSLKKTNILNLKIISIYFLLIIVSSVSVFILKDIYLIYKIIISFIIFILTLFIIIKQKRLFEN